MTLASWGDRKIGFYLPLSCLPRVCPSLEETTILEVLFDDNVGDGIEHKLDVLCVSGTSQMGVDLLDVLPQVEIKELDLDVVTSILIGIGTCR